MEIMKKSMESDIIKSYIKELQRGSHRAFNAIYDMYADKLFGFAMAHTKSQQISEDIVQETFLQLWKIHKNISTEGSLQSLLFTISKHKIVDMFRSQINKVEFELYVEYGETKDAHFETSEIENKLYYDDFLKSLKLSKKLLSERQLEIFEMSREKGITIEEIANQLNLSEQTVKNQLTTSLKKIRSQLTKLSGQSLMCFLLSTLTAYF